MEVLTQEFLWATIIAFVVLGVAVLTKVPELLVAVLVIGQEAVQFSLFVLGFRVTRRDFAVAGAVLFVPLVLLFLILRLSGRSEHEPILFRRNLWFILAVMVMGLVFLIGLTYTDAPDYGAQKTREYFVFGVAPMILVFVFLQDQASMYRLFVWIGVIALMNILLATGYSLATGQAVTMESMAGGETEWGLEIPGHAALGGSAIMLLIVAFYAAGRSRRFVLRVLPFVALPLVAFYLVYSGSRSNVVTFLLVTVMASYFAYRHRRGVLVLAAVFLVLMGALWYMFGPEDVNERLFSSWIDPETVGGASGYARVVMLEQALSQTADAPVMGHGTGDWAFLSTGFDVYSYPHNMFAEVAVENGIIGLLVLLLLWYIVVKRVWESLRDSEPGSAVYGVAVFGLGLVSFELSQGLSHFGLAHHSCTMLLSFALVLRSLSLASEEEETEAPEMLHAVLREGAFQRPA